MQQKPLDLLDDDDRKELERLLSIIHSETMSAAAKLEELSRLLAKHGLLLPAPVTEQTWSATELATELMCQLTLSAGWQPCTISKWQGSVNGDSARHPTGSRLRPGFITQRAGPACLN